MIRERLTIRLRILKNELYVGTMVQGKSRKINYKVKKSLLVDIELCYRKVHIYLIVI